VLRGAAYGAIEGAVESGSNIEEVVSGALDGARAAGQEVGLSTAESTSLAVQGLLDAASVYGGEVLASVRRSIGEDPLGNEAMAEYEEEDTYGSNEEPIDERGHR
jgi:hypothetical protein